MTDAIPRIVWGAQHARQTVLHREALDEYVVSPELSHSIERLFGEKLTPDEVVARILSDVREQGDQSLHHYSRLLDGDKTDELIVPAERITEAWERTPDRLRDALQLSVDRIRSFYERQPRQSWIEWDEIGGGLGQIVRPMDRVGIYAPHGSAPYPSSLLMAAIPAQVAGVPEIVVATPRRNGDLNDTILAAAHAANVHQVYAIGGAQAIAALAYGTESVTRVDKIVGPGNIFIVLAKRRVYGRVGIDALPGPTETLIVADDTANPAYVAADLLAQAEHDPLATALLITPSESLARAVQQAVSEQIQRLSRTEIARISLAERGGIVVVHDIDEAMAIANEYAPEHLCLLTGDPWALVGKVKHAGGVFVGELSSEALGDYVVGPSHIMPTGQTARFSSPLNVWDFCKITSVFGISAATAREVSDAAITLAEKEGLTAHAAAVRVRMHALEEGSEPK